MKNFRNFLAVWAALVLTVFATCEFIEVIKAVVKNAVAAYKITTDWRVVVGAMIIAALATIIANIVIRKRG